MGQEAAKPFRTELMWRRGSRWSGSVLSFNGVCWRGHISWDTGPQWAERWPRRQVWPPVALISLGALVTAVLPLDQVIWKQGWLWGDV